MAYGITVVAVEEEDGTGLGNRMGAALMPPKHSLTDEDDRILSRRLYRSRAALLGDAMPIAQGDPVPSVHDAVSKRWARHLERSLAVDRGHERSLHSILG
jgi:hypothetical protein